MDIFLLIQRQDLLSIQALLSENPQLISTHRWSGLSPLHRAVSTGNIDLVEYLISKGAEVNARAVWGWYTPLHLACKSGNEPMIWKLLEHGAKWNLKDKYNKTPLQWAVRNGKAGLAYRIDRVRLV